MTRRKNPLNLTTELSIPVPQCKFKKTEAHHPNFSLISLKDAPQDVIFTLGRLLGSQCDLKESFLLSSQSQKCQECNTLFSLVLLGGLVCGFRKCLNAETLIKSSLSKITSLDMDNGSLLIAPSTTYKEKVRTMFKSPFFSEMLKGPLSSGL